LTNPGPTKSLDLAISGIRTSSHFSDADEVQQGI